MLITDIFHIPTWSSLLVIALVLTVAIVASLVRAKRLPAQPSEETAKSPIGRS